jgi:hypothetical protein
VTVNDNQHLNERSDGQSWVDQFLAEFADGGEDEFVFERDRDCGRDIDF